MTGLPLILKRSEWRRPLCDSNCWIDFWDHNVFQHIHTKSVTRPWPLSACHMTVHSHMTIHSLIYSPIIFFPEKCMSRSPDEARIEWCPTHVGSVEWWHHGKRIVSSFSCCLEETVAVVEWTISATKANMRRLFLPLSWIRLNSKCDLHEQRREISVSPLLPWKMGWYFTLQKSNGSVMKV